MQTRKLITSLDLLIKSALTSFVRDIRRDPRWRRERELINLFVFGHLAPRCRRGDALHHLTQIGIEAAVPQLPGRGGPRKNSDVCKDLVIWPKPKMTCWGREGKSRLYPLAVLEWKSINKQDRSRSIAEKRRDYNKDVRWLLRTSRLVDQFVGYAIIVNQKAKLIEVSATRTYRGDVLHDWWPG